MPKRENRSQDLDFKGVIIAAAGVVVVIWLFFRSEKAQHMYLTPKHTILLLIKT
jgi:hypothetical protein